MSFWLEWSVDRGYIGIGNDLEVQAMKNNVNEAKLLTAWENISMNHIGLMNATKLRRILVSSSPYRSHLFKTNPL